MQVVDKLGFVDYCAKLLEFNLKYSWYSSLENLGSAALALEILIVLSGKPCKEK